jgi:dTDP-glucose 4,6-dehydratase/UDP-glucose 4-epimerase
MQVLIIGSKGFVGSHAVNYFAAKGYAMAGCDVQSPDGTENYTYYNTGGGGTGLQDVFTAVNPDICINAAGNGSVPVSIVNPQLDFEANVQFHYIVLELIRHQRPTCKYLHLSSAAVYGNPGKLPVKETDEIKPLSPYGWHKYLAELACKEYAVLYGLQTISLRVFSVYGPRLRKQLFWDTWQKAKKEGPVQMFGTGHESRDFIYIDDLMEAIACIMDRAFMHGQPINIASGTETTISDAVHTFMNMAGAGKAVQFTQQVKAGDPLYWKADIDELLNLGFTPKNNLQTGLTYTVQWLKENA